MLSTDSIDLLRNYFRSGISEIRLKASAESGSASGGKTIKREEVNIAYSLTSGELFVAEKS